MCRIIFSARKLFAIKTLIPLASFFLLGVNASVGAPVTSRDCQARLGEIADGHLSADDTLVLNDCALAGLISSSDIERAYERAKSGRQ